MIKYSRMVYFLKPNIQKIFGDVSRILNMLYATCKPEYATDLKSHKTNYTDDIVLNRIISYSQSTVSSTIEDTVLLEYEMILMIQLQTTVSQ